MIIFKIASLQGQVPGIRWRQHTPPRGNGNFPNGSLSFAPLWRFGRETSRDVPRDVHHYGVLAARRRFFFWKRKLFSFSQRPDVSRPKRHSGARLAGRLATSRGQNAIVVHFSGRRSRRSRNFTSGAQWPQRARKSTRVGALAPSCANGSSSLRVSRGEPRAASRARAPRHVKHLLAHDVRLRCEYACWPDGPHRCLA